MKKRLSFILLLIFSISLASIILANEPGAGIGEEDVEKLENLTGRIPIDPDSGKFDPDRMGFNKSIAEERIDSINEWLEENASWLKIVFGMAPEISWLFAFNIYLWLFFFVNLVLNGNIFNLVLNDFIEKWKRLLGLCVFTILLVTKVILNLATFAYKSWDIILNKLLPMGIIAVAIGIIVLVIVLAVLAIYFPQVFVAIAKWQKAKKEKKAKEQQELNQKLLDTRVKAMQ